MRIHHSQRGLSLIELMVSIAVSGVVMTVIAGSFVSQQTVSLRQQQYSDAQQNARAALSVIQHHLREAGWGFAPYVAVGVPAVGRCMGNLADDQCNNLDADGSADRLQVSSLSPDGFVLRSTDAQTTEGTISVANGFPGHPLDEDTNVGRQLVISGPCATLADETKSAADVVTITDISGGSGVPSVYTFDDSDQVACTGTYRENFNLGLLVRSEFYIDRSEASPRLMLENGDIAPHVLAYDIEDLQVQYGIDYNDLNGNAPDIWCDDVNVCNTGLVAPRENQEHIVAVRVAIVARTRDVLTGYTAPSLTVFDHEIAGEDGYRRWIYRTTIALRNVHMYVDEAAGGGG